MLGWSSNEAVRASRTNRDLCSGLEAISREVNLIATGRSSFKSWAWKTAPIDPLPSRAMTR